MPESRTFDFVVLAIGVGAVSTAAVIIRETDAPSLVISAARLSLASLPLLLIAGMRRERLVPAERVRWLLTLLSGVMLAFHFAFWITSVQETSVVTSVVLVTTAPLFVTLASGPLLGEPPGRNVWLGVGVAALGTLVMVSEDFGAGGDTLRGDVYALLGAVLAAGFLLSGRVVLGDNRRWLPFSTVTYSVAALILVVMVLLAGDSFTGYSSETYLYFALLALIPQLVGHSAINRSLGHLPAFAVSLAIQGEPVGATVLAALLLDETPTALQLIGGALVLAGVYAGLRAERRVTAVVNPSP